MKNQQQTQDRLAELNREIAAGKPRAKVVIPAPAKPKRVRVVAPWELRRERYLRETGRTEA